MGFPGRDQLGKDMPQGGGWIKLVDDQPVRVTVLGYVGKFASKKFPDNQQYRFQVQHNGNGTKNLDCNWRLMKALMEQIEQLDSALEVTITQRKVIAEIETPDGTKKKQLVNDYSLDHVKPVEADSPF